VFAVAVIGCGGSGDSDSSLSRGAGPRIAQSIRLFKCDDWRRSDVATRLAVIRQLEAIVGGDVVGSRGRVGTGPVLEEKQAYRLFQSYCGLPFARAFLLYKLYGRAAAFAGQAP
jgi:hypothetical protein